MRSASGAGALASLGAMLLVIGCGHAVGHQPLPASSRATPGRAVVTTWMADPTIAVAPHPGFRPRLTDLTSAVVQSAVAGPDPNGGGQWMVTVQFDATGSALMSRLSAGVAHACGDGIVTGCPRDHLTWWLGLTQADVDGWSTGAEGLYRPVAQGGKLLFDSGVVGPITDATVFLGGPYSREQATALAAHIRG